MKVIWLCSDRYSGLVITSTARVIHVHQLYIHFIYFI
jgi:hypothetical protein